MLIGIYSVMARTYAVKGDLEAADAAMKRSVGAYTAMGGVPGVDQWRRYWEHWTAAAQGMVLQVRGEYGEAEVFFRRSVAAMERDAEPSRAWLLDLELWRLGQVLALQGRLTEAENEARRALLGMLSKRGRYSVWTALILGGLVRVITEQGRFAEAESLARAAVDIHGKSGASGDSYYLAKARGELGAALVAQDRWQEALAEYEAIRTGMAGDPQTLQKYLGDAGARTLLASNWPVETTSTLALTTDLFRRQSADPGLTRAKALQQTMTWLIDEGQFVDPRTNRVAFSYAHPIFWAPFTLVGDGGGNR